MPEKFTADRLTKVLLASIAVALWGLLLRPLFAPTPAQAQQKSSVPTWPPSGSPVALYADKDTVFVAADGILTYFPRATNGAPNPGTSLRYPLPAGRP